jgi:hypothetical protein
MAVTPLRFAASAAWPHHVVARRADAEAVLESAAAAVAPPPDQPESRGGGRHADADEREGEGFERHRSILVRDPARDETLARVDRTPRKCMRLAYLTVC